jgi:hypothetical protein
MTHFDGKLETKWAPTLDAWRSRRLIGPFQQLVLLALVRIGPDAPAKAVRRYVEWFTVRPTSLTAVHTTLERLEARGRAKSWKRPPRYSPLVRDFDRAGPRWETDGTRRFYTATTLGWHALRETMQSADRLRRGLPGLGRSEEAFSQWEAQVTAPSPPAAKERPSRARTRTRIRSRILGAPMSAPRVDVILPVRCARETLPDAVDDVLGQTGVDVRLLAVVDVPAAGDDGTAAWLAQRARQDARLEVLEGPGRGVGAALDVGLAAVDTPWVAHMEADDRCQPDRIARQLAARAPGLAAVACRVAQTGARTPGMSRYLGWQNALLTHEDMARERFVEIPAMQQTGLYLTSAVRDCGGYSPRGEWPADIDFWFRWFEGSGGTYTRRSAGTTGTTGSTGSAGSAGSDGALRAALKLPRVMYHWYQHAGQSTRRLPTHALGVLREAKAHYLARRVGRRGAAPRAVHLVSTGGTLTAWAGALRRAGIELAGRTSWRPFDPLPDAIPRAARSGALVLAAYGHASTRQRVRERLVQASVPLPEPEDLLFTA